MMHPAVPAPGFGFSTPLPDHPDKNFWKVDDLRRTSAAAADLETIAMPEKEVQTRLHDGSAIDVEVHGEGPAVLLPVNPRPVEGPQAEELRRWGADPALGRSLIDASAMPSGWSPSTTRATSCRCPSPTR